MFSKNKRRRILQKYNGRCAYCGCSISLETMTVDHYVPKDMGGNGSYENLMPSCQSCNQLKNNDTISVFRYRMAWPSLKMADLASYDSMIKAAELFKFFYERHPAADANTAEQKAAAKETRSDRLREGTGGQGQYL